MDIVAPNPYFHGCSFDADGKDLLFNESCLNTMNRKNIKYDYIITSPPDADELEDKSWDNWYDLMNQTFEKIDPSLKTITIILRDRKMNGKVNIKHYTIINILHKFDWILKSQKIWVRSFKANLYRFNYSFILTFKRKGAKKAPGKELSIPDAIYSEIKPIEGYVDNYPTELVKTFIECYTNKREVVYDPFMGVGSTAVASINSGRQWIGSEILPDIYTIAKNRISKAYNGIVYIKALTHTYW